MILPHSKPNLLLSVALLCCLVVQQSPCAEAFLPVRFIMHTSSSPSHAGNTDVRAATTEQYTSSSEEETAEDDDEDDIDVNVGVDVDVDGNEEDIDFLFEEIPEPLSVDEQVWRYAKKPLLRIGSKGATHAHGNSLRQLLEDHTVVKVKVNTKKFDNDLDIAATTLRELTLENGGPADLETIQVRKGTNEILFAMPGTLEKMQEGTFPPPPPPEEEPSEDEASEGI